MSKQPRLTPVFTMLVLTALLQSCSSEEAAPAASAPGSTAVAASVSIRDLQLAETLDPATSTYQDLDGRGLELASFAGKRVFLNYWATWCAPCIRELPALARAAAELDDENYIFLFASDESIETISNFIGDRGFSGNFIKLNGFFGGHGIDAVPSSSVYDEQGLLLRSWAGAHEWDSEEMLNLIRNPETAAQ